MLMMRVVLNRQPTLGARTGIGHYTAELLAALAGHVAAGEIDVYPRGWMWRLCQCLLGTGSSGAGVRRRLPGLGLVRRVAAVPRIRVILRTLRPLQHRHFQHVCRREQYDLYHEPNTLPMPCDRPTVATLHDLSPLANSAWHPDYRVKQYERDLARSLKQCVHFLTGSDYTRQEIISKLGVAPERVTRVYHGIRHGLAPLEPPAIATGLKALLLPPSYLLHVGTLEPRKNLEMLTRAYCSLPEAVRNRCPLLLVGKWGWNTETLEQYLTTEGYQRGVIHLGYLAEEHLALLYNGARALVYPTLYEGFGLPPLEMMACGGAVLASNAGSVAEVVGPCGHVIDAQDADAWREAMRRVILSDDWREELRRGVRRWAAPFTWERCAAQTLRMYRMIVGGETLPLAA
jgi:alpha-1,3-rhamnosyl/mannosyltransferase